MSDKPALPDSGTVYHTDEELSSELESLPDLASDGRIALVSSITAESTEKCVFSPENGVVVEEGLAIRDTQIFSAQRDANRDSLESVLPLEAIFSEDSGNLPLADMSNAEPSLPLIAGVRLTLAGPMYFYRVMENMVKDLRAQGKRIAPGDKVMVEGDTGPMLAEIVILRRMDATRLTSGKCSGLGAVLSPADPEDVGEAAKNATLATEARTYCQNCIRERELDMKLVDVEVSHDRGKIAFYFTAPARIDFRELVKDLVRKYRTRIELRQIGVRHEAQMLGAVGNCGMVCCCRRYLRNFVSVAIKMAKEQNVFLNPAKISGICGRLLCCLAYEQENYDEFYRHCPKLGKKYVTSHGVMRVLRANMFKESIHALSEHNEELEFTLEEWKALEPRRNEGGVPQGAQGGGRPLESSGCPMREERMKDGAGRSGKSRDVDGGQKRPERNESRQSHEHQSDPHANRWQDQEETTDGFAADSENAHDDQETSPGLRHLVTLKMPSSAQDTDDEHDENDDSSIFGLSPRKYGEIVSSSGRNVSSEERRGHERHRRPRHHR